LTKIENIKAREILSSGATPSLEVKVTLSSTMTGVASVPFGSSAGVHEACVLLDNDPNRFLGKGMLNAVRNINEKIAPKLLGMEPYDQRGIDQIMIDLDGTENKSSLGGNAILGVSLAVARAASNERMLPLYKYIRNTFGLDINAWRLPNPMMVVIEGGKHADNSTDLQEYMVAPIGNTSARENIRMGIECFLNLKNILKSKGFTVNVGNEGAFAPSGLESNESPLPFIREAIVKAGREPGKDIGIALDPAVSEIFEDGFYNLKKEGKKLTSDQMIDYFSNWVEKYPEIVVLEDGLDQDDWDNWPKLNQRLGGKVAIMGDDLTVTNPKRLQTAIDYGAINSILIKLNQIGSLTECVDCCMLARKYGMMTVVSHRGGGETNDTSMVDLAVAVNSGFIKVGPSRGERVCKYNRLMEIEEELGQKSSPAGNKFKQVV
jgi:enolase